MPAATTPLTLLEKLQRADENAWTRLDGIYRPFIRQILVLGGLTDHDVDDLVQDVLLVLFREVPRFRHSGRRGAFRLWLRTVVRNRILGFRRKNATQCETRQRLESLAASLEDPTSDPGLYWEQQHNRHVVGRLLELLESDFTVTTWQAFKRQTIDGHSARETADELGLSINAALIAKSRVLRKLREQATGLID